MGLILNSCCLVGCGMIALCANWEKHFKAVIIYATITPLFSKI